MNKSLFILVVPPLLLIPTFTLASTCSSAGATIVYVNGIETTQQEADHDTALLNTRYLDYGGFSDIKIITGYNPSHLDGYGDELESISQAFNAPISDYDLDTILTQIAPEVTTRKLLLVGHSQGTFYTNEMYKYLVHNGVPLQSIAVYNIATPASSVAGEGNYLTSANDKVINYVRELDAEANAPQALSANIIVPPESGYTDDVWGGHVPEVYLDGAPQRIVSDIQNALGKLSVPDEEASGSCFTTPSVSLAYDAQKAVFVVADPAVANIDLAAFEAKTTIASVADNANDILHAAFSDVLFSIIPRPTAQNAAGAFAVEKALYGSSLSVADYEALVNGENIPEVQTPSQSAPQVQKNIETPDPQPMPSQPTEDPAPEQQAPQSIVSPTMPAPMSISPGFGGGSATIPVANVPAQITSNIDTDTAASSSPSDQTTDQPVATTTLSIATTTPDVQTNVSTSTATSTDPTDALATSPLIDAFDSGASGWNNYLPGWSSVSWDTATSDCYAGDCLSETSYDQQYENIKYGTALTSGSFVIYFRNDGYGGEFGVGVCADNSVSECQNTSSIGGTNPLLFIFPIHYWDNIWHYAYFTFRDGAQNKEFCGLVDDDDPADCTWQGASAPSGTAYSGVVLFTANGLNPGTSFYWDELGTSPYSPTGP